MDKPKPWCVSNRVFLIAIFCDDITEKFQMKRVILQVLY